MKKIVLRLLSLALASIALQAPAHAGEAPRVPIVLDRIVAVVNDEVITRIELDERMKVAVRQLNQQGTPLPPQEVIQRQLLERLITDRVQLQFA
ncbi:MAG TPA: SurA N-terminal domain-containing protein, partial [Burkholderiales bacterium]|nr:SurA N-terminal domain-containing protein [Burkholderiales bacterium]